MSTEPPATPPAEPPPEEPAPTVASALDSDAPPVPPPGTAAPPGLAELQAAVGVPPRPAPPAAPRPSRPSGPSVATRDDDDLDERPRRARRWPLILAGVGTLAAAIAATVLLGQANAQRYELRCSAKQITAERGRGFPPWGTERLEGALWAPIAIPPAAECTARRTEDPRQLEGWYLEALVEQATAKLSGETPGDVDLAERQLEQALLLTRSPERRDERKELERLLGDVTYWRAAAKVKAATAALGEAARQFDEATARRPRHASDAGAWAELARTTAAALGAGPGGAGAPQQPPSGVPLPARPPAPPGVALPVEPPPAIDAGPAEAPVDAGPTGLPAGGVLL